MSGSRVPLRRGAARLSLAGVLLLSARPGAEDLASGPATLVVRRDGNGFVDEIRLGERAIVATRDGFVGASIALAPGATDGAASLFPREVTATLRAEIRSIEVEDDGLTVRGAYAGGALELPFCRRITPGTRDGSFRVREELDFASLGSEHLVAEHRVDIPLRVCEDEHLRMLAFGGARRAEMFRMDMNDEPRRNQLISDNRAFRPYWDIGGVEKRPGSYRIWRANHDDTFAYPVEEGAGGAGWADYSEPEVGLTVQVRDPEEAAPWSLRIDARKGVFSVLLYPPSEVPVDGRTLGKRTFECVIALHDGSWPAALPCELPFDRYRALLAFLDRGERFTHLDHALRSLGVAAKEGCKTAEELEDLARRLILRERVQPSVLLRLLYRGDAWRMQGIVREVLGRSVPRNMELERWEVLARELLGRFAKGEVPGGS